jgi:hypothetical protein
MILTHSGDVDLSKRRDEGAHSDRPSATNISTKKTSHRDKVAKGLNTRKADKSPGVADGMPAKAMSKAKTTTVGSQAKTKSASKAGPAKADNVLKKLHSARGVTIAQIMEMTGWQAHSVRGFLSGVVKKKLGFDLTSEIGKDGLRHYRIAEAADHAAVQSQSSKKNSGRGSASGSGADVIDADGSADTDGTSQVSDEATLSSAVVASQKA